MTVRSAGAFDLSAPTSCSAACASAATMPGAVRLGEEIALAGTVATVTMTHGNKVPGGPAVEPSQMSHKHILRRNTHTVGPKHDSTAVLPEGNAKGGGAETRKRVREEVWCGL